MSFSTINRRSALLLMGSAAALTLAGRPARAAGDSFNGGLAHAIEQGLPLIEAVRFASACGALSATKKGASAAAPTRAEVDAFLRRD